MNILVIGAGEVGLQLAKLLSREGHRVTMVDKDAAALARVASAADVRSIAGHAGDHQTLQDAGAAEADLVVAGTNNDELNMLAAFISRKLGARKTAVRIHAARHVLENQYYYKDILGFDLTISPEEMAAMEILRVLRGQNAMPVESFAGGRLQMRRLEILPDSPAAGKRFAELKIPQKVVATGVLRGSEVAIPRGDFAVEAGDFLMLIGIPEALDKSEKVLGGRRDLPKRVIVSGGGNITLLVARDLKPRGVSVSLIAEDAAAARFLSENLDGAEIIRGSGTDLDLLSQEAVHRADWFISLGPHDETNLLACQLAKSAGAQRTIALVNHPDYASLVDRLGIDHALTPRRLVARRIAQFVRTASDGSITQIHHGAAEVLDKHVPEGSRHAGRTLQEMDLPLGTVVGGIVRGDEVLVPRGETTVEAGDHLIVFALREVLRDVQEFFAPPGAQPVPGEEA